MRSLLPIVVALAGCAAVPSHEPAPGAPQAAITLERQGFKVMVLEFFANGENCTDRRTLPGGSAFWDGKPIALEAGREVAFGMATIVDTQISGMQAINTRCTKLIVSFKPEADASYRLKYHANLAEKVCRVALVRVGADGREAPEPSTRWREPAQCAS